MNFTELKLVLEEANKKDALLNPPKNAIKIPTALSLSQAEKAQEKNFKELFEAHTEHADKMEADECFHQLSQKSGIEDRRYLDYEHMQTAVDDVFAKWDISLTEEGETAFKNNHFEPTWNKMAKDGKVMYDETPKFLAALTKTF